MIDNQSEEDFNPFRWAAHFTFASPGPVLHDCVKQHILEDVDLAFGPDFDDEDLPAIHTLPSELLVLINSVDTFFIQNKKDAENSHDRMTTFKLKDNPIDFATAPSPSTLRRVVLKLNANNSSPHPKSLSPLANELWNENAFETLDHMETQENIESVESFLCELSTKNDPWTLSECQDALSSMQSLTSKLKTNDWLPQQVNVEAFLKKSVENLENTDEQIKSTIFCILEIIIGSGIGLSESLVLTTFSTALSYIRSKRSVPCLKCIVEMFYALESQLMSELWRVCATILGGIESATTKNSLADSFSQLLLHLLHVHYSHQPESIVEFMEKFADELVEFILEKKHLEIISKFSQRAFQLGLDTQSCPYLSNFIERFQKLLLAVLTGKLDITYKNFAMDRLGDILSSYACIDQLSENVKTTTAISGTTKIANVILKLIGEDSAIIRLKSVRMLYSVSEYPSTSLNIKSSFPAILVRCLQDPSVMIRDASVELLTEYISKHGLTNPELTDSLDANSLLKSKILPTLQYLIAQNVTRKNEIIAKLLESTEHSQFLKENWITPIIHNENFMHQLVETFALVPQPYCLLDFISTVEQDPLIGRQFSKASENIVDNLIEKLIDEDCPKSDHAINNLMQSLLVFCYGRYEVLSPHLSVLCYYAFDAKLANTAMTSCQLLSLLVEGSTSLDLKQQPRIIEKIAKAIVQSSEQMLPHLLKCLSIFENEISKLVDKFKNFLGNADFSASVSATCRSLLVLGHCANYYSFQDDILNLLTEFIGAADPQIQAYSQMAFCLFIPKTLNFKPINSQLLAACLKSNNIRVRKQALRSIIEALERLETHNKEQAPSVNFDPKAFNSVRSQVSNTQGTISEVLDSILEMKSKDDEQSQIFVVKIMNLLLKGALLNPSLIIPSIIGCGFGTFLREARELFIEAHERYSSLVTGAYQKGLQLAFKICGNADMLVAEELLNYVMHTKNKWKDIRYCVMSIFGKSKDIEYCRWLLYNLQTAGVSSFLECEMALKLGEQYILPLAEIYYEELENVTDPVIINKLSFLLQFQSVLKNTANITESLGRRKGSVQKIPGNSIQILEESQLHSFIESQNISLNDENERLPLNMKSTRKRKRKTRDYGDNEVDPINKNFQV